MRQHGRYDHWEVYHVAKMDYRVIDRRSGKQVATARNVSEAYRAARAAQDRENCTIPWCD